MKLADRMPGILARYNEAMALLDGKVDRATRPLLAALCAVELPDEPKCPESTVAKVRDYVLDIPPGDPLGTLSKAAQRLGLKAWEVSEALRVLESEGLCTKEHIKGKPAFVHMWVRVDNRKTVVT